MRNPFGAHWGGFWTPARKRSMYLGIVLIVLAAIVQITLGQYSASRSISAAPAGDIFLDNLPVINLDFVIVFWGIMVWIIAWWLLTTHPDHLIFGTKAIALYVICRAFFISLTHIGPYPTQMPPGPSNVGFWFYRMFTFQGNYFFSGHTGFPFLIALIFWNNTILRRLFLILTFIFGASVLLAHVHYSIDVFAAPFIVYGVYVIAAKIFPQDYELLPHPAAPRA
jgi:hypothetical protein